MQKIKVLFYGFRHGHIFGFYKYAVASETMEIVGCLEPDAEARAKAEAELGAWFPEKSYESWLTSDIDVVVVGLAFADRGAAIQKALAAGKHVMADKPVCITQEELDGIRELCETKRVKLGCLLDLRYLPQSLKAKEILQSGRLGEVRNVAFNGQHCLDYAHRPSWYFVPGMQGGTINDLAIHGVDLVRMLTGMEFTKIDAARTWNAYAERHSFFKDSALFMAQLENGAGVLADVSYSGPSQIFSMPVYWEFRFWCEKGMLTFSLVDDTVTIYEEGYKEPQIIHGSAPEYDCAQEFIREIETGSDLVTNNVIQSTQATLWLQQHADRN